MSEWYVDGTTAVNMENIVRVFASYNNLRKPVIKAETITGREIVIAELEPDTKGLTYIGEIRPVVQKAAQEYVERMVHLIEANKHK